MSHSLSTLAPRPSLAHRSISEQAPLYNPSSAPHSGSRLRASNAVSGAHTATGSKLPYSPLLPLPPAPASTNKLGLEHAALLDPEYTDNAEPSSFQSHHGAPHSPSALAARRLARRGISETFASHSHQPPRSNRNPAAAVPSAFPALSPKIALRLDIAAASHLSGKPAASRSAGMIRSYSLPVATQAEHDEQQRIMALGLSPASRHPVNPSWWQYGWPSPGGINQRHVHHPSPAVPEFVGQRRRSSQSKLSSVLTPIADTAMESSPPSRPSSRSAKIRSSCSPKMKSKHLPSIHQHSLQNASSRSASASPKSGRSPLSMMSINLPALDQQLEQSGLLDDDDDDDDDDGSVADSSGANLAEAAFDIEMDALNQRFAEWSRSQALATPNARTRSAEQQDDYFNLVHDADDVDHTKTFLGVGSDTSDEARTPRASSPRPLSKKALYQHDQQQPFEPARWGADVLDFIHPDHLA